MARANKSPPAWGRGLKQYRTVKTGPSITSPPAWGRGLKRQKNVFDIQGMSRPPRGGVD